MDNPLVSIIIPYYNHGEYLQACLDSIFKSSYSNIEIILVNDSSTDSFSIEQFEKVKFEMVSKFTIPNGGPCTSKNFGVSKASGEILGFLDSDNEFLNDYISESVEKITSTNAVWGFGDAEYFGDEKGIRSQKIKGKEEIFINSPIDNCLFIQKKVFDKVGGFDEKLNRLGLEDWEFTLRLIIGNHIYFHIEKPLFKYRVLKKSRSNSEAKENQREIIKYVFDKHHDTLFAFYSNMFFNKQLLENRKEVKIGEKFRQLLGRP